MLSPLANSFARLTRLALTAPAMRYFSVEALTGWVTSISTLANLKADAGFWVVVVRRHCFAALCYRKLEVWTRISLPTWTISNWRYRFISWVTRDVTFLKQLPIMLVAPLSGTRCILR